MFITFSPWDEPAQQLFVKLGWLNIYDIYKHKIQTLAHQVGTNPSHFTTKFPDIRETDKFSDIYLSKIAPSWPIKKNPGDLFLIRKNRTVNFGKRSISNQIVSYWNGFNAKLRQPLKTTTFKKTLKKQLLYSPTLYHKYSNEDLEDLINCIGEARVKNKFYL